MHKINWGIIGCGDVTELKSGPAFNKVKNSALLAVMRRDTAKAKDYAERHGVPLWYDDANELINNVDVNAIYIATPPDTHEYYTLAAFNAGKPVYVEKPITLDAASAHRIIEVAAIKNIKLVVAHYRRAQPMFMKMKEMLQQQIIGEVKNVQLNFFSKPLSAQQLEVPKLAWRINPIISGGGLFHDLAPHQLGLMLYFFGNVKHAKGTSSNLSRLYAADDTVNGNIIFENDVEFTGHWNFNALPDAETDECIIRGTEGNIKFSVFGKQQISLTIGSKETFFLFEPLVHVQQPMIEKVVQYFLDKAPNPCPADEGYEVMKLMDTFTLKG